MALKRIFILKNIVSNIHVIPEDELFFSSYKMKCTSEETTNVLFPILIITLLSELIAVGPDLSPHYYFKLAAYREKFPETAVGQPGKTQVNRS